MDVAWHGDAGWEGTIARSALLARSTRHPNDVGLHAWSVRNILQQQIDILAQVCRVEYQVPKPWHLAEALVNASAGHHLDREVIGRGDAVLWECY